MRAIAIACVFAVGCANNVPQDRMTGPDGKQKGATPIALENGEGKSTGIVTYPGGDRVDWKIIEIPEGKRGRLDLTMKWSTPRPGLQLGFDVFDQYNQPVANAKGSRGRVREATVGEAKGKYFVRVYAKGRGDAGQYKLAVAFQEEVKPKIPDPLSLQIPDPPRLPDVPPPTCPAWDVKDPTCPIKQCPAGAPADWPGCVAPTPPPGTPPPGTVTPPTPPPPPPAKPVLARVLSVAVQGDWTIVTIGAGRDQGIEKTWAGQVMRGTTKDPLVGGKITIIRVDQQKTIAKVQLTTDTVTANPLIILSP